MDNPENEEYTNQELGLQNEDKKKTTDQLWQEMPVTLRIASLISVILTLIMMFFLFGSLKP